MILHDALDGVQEVFIPGTNIGSPNDLLRDIQANPVFDEELKAFFHAGALDRARQSRSEIEGLLDPKVPIRVTGTRSAEPSPQFSACIWSLTDSK
jgi:hypothetical protein